MKKPEIPELEISTKTLLQVIGTAILARLSVFAMDTISQKVSISASATTPEQAQIHAAMIVVCSIAAALFYLVFLANVVMAVAITIQLLRGHGSKPAESEKR